MLSFVKQFRKKKDPVVSFCSFTRGRQEIRKVSKTWQDQRFKGEVEYIVAEFGEKPVVFPTEKEQSQFDTYIFGWMPKTIPFMASWWRNVSLYAGVGRFLMQCDSDTALGPAAVQKMVDIARSHRKKYKMPVAVHPTRLLHNESDSYWKTWDDLKYYTATRVNYECIWLFERKTFYKTGGWPETFVGYIGEDKVFNPEIKKVFNVTRPNSRFDMCHVPHMPLDGEEKREAINVRSIFGFDRRKGDRWPIQKWKPGRATLVEEAVNDPNFVAKYTP